MLHYLLLFCHAAEETEDILIYAICNCSCHQTITVLLLLYWKHQPTVHDSPVIIWCSFSLWLNLKSEHMALSLHWHFLWHMQVNVWQTRTINISTAVKAMPLQSWSLFNSYHHRAWLNPWFKRKVPFYLSSKHIYCMNEKTTITDVTLEVTVLLKFKHVICRQIALNIVFSSIFWLVKFRVKYK